MPITNVEKRRAWQREWYATHREECCKKMREYTRVHAEQIRKQRHEKYMADPEKDKARSRKWAANNLEQRREYNRKWRAVNKERLRKNARRYAGAINPTGEAKHGPCEICGTTTQLNFDHNHKTGLHRGWLCASCNSGIGYFKDDPEILRKAISYLEMKGSCGQDG